MTDISPSPALGIHSIDHFCLEVPSLVDASKFFNEFGLDVREAFDGSLELRTFASPHLWGRLVAGDARRLVYLSFGCYADDLSRFRQLLGQHGIAITPPHARALENDGIWFADLNGLPVQIRVGDKKTTSEPIIPAVQVPRPGMRNVGVGQPARRAVPKRFSHMLVFVPDVLEALAFYDKMLGLRLSDKTGDAIAFTHAIHGSDHHLLAFAKSPQIGLHHTSWVMESLEDVGIATAHMQAAGYHQGWGVGRHVLGSNYFSYIQDPWGSYAEYGFGIDQIPAGVEWDSVSLGHDDPLNVWGPEMPAEFIHNRS